MSRRGNHRLKNAMFLAAFAPLRSSESTAYYDREVKGRKHNAALICLARRRTGVLWGHAQKPTALPATGYVNGARRCRLNP